jgi:hypothetical protein
LQWKLKYELNGESNFLEMIIINFHVAESCTKHGKYICIMPYLFMTLNRASSFIPLRRIVPMSWIRLHDVLYALGPSKASSRLCGPHIHNTSHLDPTRVICCHLHQTLSTWSINASSGLCGPTCTNTSHLGPSSANCSHLC